MKKHSRVFIFLVLSGLLMSCGDDAPDAGHVAEVGGQPISKAELEWEMHHVSPGSDRRERALKQLLERKQMVAKARERGLDGDPKTRRSLDGVLIRQLQTEDLQPKLDAVAATAEQIQQRYETATDQWQQPESVILAVLFLPSSPEDTVRRKGNRQLLEQAKEEAGKLPVATGFGRLAVTHSQHQETRYQGGILPPFSPLDQVEGWRKEVLQSSTGLEVGAFTSVVETKEGHYLARVVERAESRRKSFEEVRHEIKRQLMEEGQQAVRDQYAKRLNEAFPWVVNQQQLEAVTEPNSVPRESLAGLPDPVK
ncbi:peptidyl-prolyl cis-trans isomerase [Phragmitibacter flavus]|uniref:peptidylprolyl isomerase n=1 Tax=Phragmitibacter flavus TaxID=2576071 RepID=A0A5R8KBX5_9BACT|nr:peptidylprolyl isomerase [Phragmitibacter flavus]TLD69069.1 peptidyl-prolyl cis-trans isomerase [Phragmitibacter flavus]